MDPDAAFLIPLTAGSNLYTEFELKWDLLLTFAVSPPKVTNIIPQLSQNYKSNTLLTFINVRINYNNVVY